MALGLAACKKETPAPAPAPDSPPAQTPATNEADKILTPDELTNH
jgi:hypothetical protein